MVVSVIRCITLYVAVVVAVRIMGKRQIGELQPSELVITIMLSELAALPLQDVNMPLIWGIMPMFLMVALELIMSYLTLKSMVFRRICYGNPIMLVYGGVINKQNLMKTRVSVEDIMESMRGQGISTLEDVQTAVLETNGTISIIPKQEAAPPTARDLKIKPKKDGGVPVIIVMDGHIVEHNMKAKGTTEKDLEVIIQNYGVAMEDIFMLTIDDSENTYLIKRDEK